MWMTNPSVFSSLTSIVFVIFQIPMELWGKCLVISFWSLVNFFFFDNFYRYFFQKLGGDHEGANVSRAVTWKWGTFFYSEAFLSYFCFLITSSDSYTILLPLISFPLFTLRSSAPSYVRTDGSQLFVLFPLMDRLGSAEADGLFGWRRSSREESLPVLCVRQEIGKQFLSVHDLIYLLANADLWFLSGFLVGVSSLSFGPALLRTGEKRWNFFPENSRVFHDIWWVWLRNHAWLTHSAWILHESSFFTRLFVRYTVES